MISFIDYLQTDGHGNSESFLFRCMRSFDKHLLDMRSDYPWDKPYDPSLCFLIVRVITSVL